MIGVDEETLLSLLEVSCTPMLKETTTSEIGVERIGQRKHRFQCLCGAGVVTSEKTVNCTNCGKTLGIRRVKHTHWHIAPHRGVQSLQQLGIYTALSALFLCYLYNLVRG
jgi:hypothetical protein